MNFCEIQSRFRHRASGITFVVTNRRDGRGYDVEFRKARKSLGILRDVRPPQCRAQSNAHKSDEHLVIEAAISFATCGPYAAGYTISEVLSRPEMREWSDLHENVGDDIPADRYNACGEGIYWLESVDR